MNGVLTVLLIILPSFATAQNAPSEKGMDFAQQDPYMSDLYMRGRWLVYDCAGGHWACTRREEFERCRRWRREDLLYKETRPRCAAFRRYLSLAKCRDKQLELTSRPAPTEICLHPARR